MTSTPVSLNDDSLNGSWIDINSASQIHSPMDDDSPEFLAPPYSLAESVQNLGLISFQVERFLQEHQRNQQTNITSSSSNNNISQQQQQNLPLVADGGGDEDNSGIYSSDTDVSVDGVSSRALIDRLRRQQKRQQHNQHHVNAANAVVNGTNLQASNNNDLHSSQATYHPATMNHAPRLSKSGESLVDQLSDSLSLLSRASAFGEPSFNKQTASDLAEDFDWLWDWTAQPEYFSGQEWKVYAPKQDYLMRQRQLYCATMNRDHSGTPALFSGEVISLLFLTNILSIIIGAGLTYSILMRRSNI